MDLPEQGSSTVHWNTYKH